MNPTVVYLAQFIHYTDEKAQFISKGIILRGPYGRLNLGLPLTAKDLVFSP